MGTVLDCSNSSSRQSAPDNLVFPGGHKGGSDPMKPAPSTFSKKAASTRRWMPCQWPCEVASTVAEHETLAARDHVSTNAPRQDRAESRAHEPRSRDDASANAPGRIEGSREHTDLVVMRHATLASASTSASSRGEPHARDSHVRRQTRSAPRPPRRRDANHEVPRRAPPLGPAGRLA